MVYATSPSDTRSGKVSAEQARWIANFEILMTPGDGMTISLLEPADVDGNPVWRAEVMYSTTG